MTENKRLIHEYLGITINYLIAGKVVAAPDIQACVAFLCTQVKSPTEQDYKKLGRVISYLKEIVHLPLVIGADNSGTLTWNVDAHLQYIQIVKVTQEHA